MKRIILQDYEPEGQLPDIEGIANKVRKVKQYVTMFGLMVFCMIFIGVGIFVMSFENRDKRECTIPVNSRVIDLVASSSSSSGRTYAPVYEFEFEGRTYKVQSNSYSSPCPFSVGEEVKIYVDPDDPKHIYSPKDKTTLTVAIVFIAIGAVGAIAFMVLGVKTLMKSKRDNGEETYVDEQYTEYPDEVTEYYSEDNQY